MHVEFDGWKPRIHIRKHSAKRFLELDILRGIAIAYMIFLHVIWDLDYFGLLPLNAVIYQTNQIAPVMFFLLVGICLSITYNKKKDKPDHYLEKHLFKRGMWIISLGMIITVVTLIFMSDRPIFFGVLHCIGLSIILAIPFLRLKRINILPGSIIILLGVFITRMSVNNPSIVHLLVGLHPTGFWQYTVDYFPLFPWFGIVLLGITLGNILYKNGQRQFHFPDLSNRKSVNLISWMGQHSLEIYLVHQPVIAGILGIYLFF